MPFGERKEGGNQEPVPCDTLSSTDIFIVQSFEQSTLT